MSEYLSIRDAACPGAPSIQKEWKRKDHAIGDQLQKCADLIDKILTSIDLRYLDERNSLLNLRHSLEKIRCEECKQDDAALLLNQKKIALVDTLSRISTSDITQIVLPQESIPAGFEDLIDRVYFKHIIEVQQGSTDHKTQQKTLKKIFKAWINKNQIDNAIRIAKDKLDLNSHSFVMQFIVKALVEPKKPEDQNVWKARDLAFPMQAGIYRDAALQKVSSGFIKLQLWNEAFEAASALTGKAKAFQQRCVIEAMVSKPDANDLDQAFHFTEQMPHFKEKDLAIKSIYNKAITIGDQNKLDKAILFLEKNNNCLKTNGPSWFDNYIPV